MATSDGKSIKNDIIERKGSECMRFMSYKREILSPQSDHILPDQHEDEEQIKQYLSYEGIQNYRDDEGHTLLHMIGKTTPLSTIKLLVETGVPIDTPDNKGYTPLLMAVTYENVDAVRYLISLYANINIKPDTGGLYSDILIDLICSKRSIEMLKLLVDAKANLSIKNNEPAESLLCVALNSGTPWGGSVELVRYLVDKLGCDVNARGGHSQHPLIKVVSLNTYEPSSPLETLQFLINRNADLNVSDHEGRRAVHFAAKSLSTHGLETLVKAGANINAEDYYGRRPIHFAAGCSPECLQYILRQTVDINVQDRDGWTPLMWAACWGKENSIRNLVKAGADLWCRGSGFETEWSALKLARFRFWVEVDIPELLSPRELTRKTIDGKTEMWEKDFHKSSPSYCRNGSKCNSCGMEIIGLEWRCMECQDEYIRFCFKCYSHVGTLHGSEHNFKGIGPLYSNHPTPREDDLIDDQEYSEDGSVHSVEEVPEIDYNSVVGIEDYDDCDVSILGSDSVDNDTEWMMLYHERTIKI
ncbi:ankyrin repeat-containing domain protein [Annulohypoxylon nitens]|nr:ankyrin repeat-containing domain protein [Annulohypoxylon nitens]